MRRLILSAALLAVWALPGRAQQREPEFQRWRARFTAQPDEAQWALRRFAPDTLTGTKRDHRYEGLAIGGLALGALGAWMGSGSAASADCLLEPGAGCGDSEQLGQAILGGLVGAAIGGSLGYVIGRWSGGNPRPAAADSSAR
jgi:hypothetical protein